MSTINIVHARGIFTSTLQAVYQEKTFPTSFLRSFFPNKESDSKYVAIEVSRGTEKVAVDVERGTRGNRNQFGKSSEKIFQPPYYKEYFDATDLDFYDRLFSASGVVDANQFASWMNTIVEKLMMLQDKIERAYELQCSQVLETGIVTLKNGTNIDFKRKAASKVDKGAGNYWATATVNPYTDLENGAVFIRTKGKAQGDVFNVIMGSSAAADFFNNAIVKERADIRNFGLDMIREPQRNSVGGTLHGQVSAGSYRFNIWTYPEYYDTEAAENQPYVNPKIAVILPEAPKFNMMFAGVPQLLGQQAQVGAGLASQRGAYLIGEYLDEANESHNINIKSAGVAVPVAVDMIYTVQVVA